MRQFSSRAKLTILLALVTPAVFSVFLWTVTGGTVLNLSLTTNPDLERGLVGHWTFDGSQEARIVDRSGNENHGNFIGGATSSAVRPGKTGQSFAFDGVDDFASISIGGTIRSLAFWAKPDSTTEKMIDFPAAGGGGGGEDWYDSNYSFCRTFTMTAGGGNGGVATTTTNGFALVATSTIADLKHTSHGGDIELLSNGTTSFATPIDVVMTNGTDCDEDSGTKIPFYFEQYSSSTGAFTLHLRADDISSTTAKTVLMYYGNGTAIDESNEAGVYGSLDENGVWNLSEDPSGTAPQMKDSLGVFDGTVSGTVDPVVGQVDGALYLDTVGSGYVAVPDHGATSTDPFTISLWLRQDSYVDNRGIFSLNILDSLSPFIVFTNSTASYQYISFGTSFGLLPNTRITNDISTDIVSKWNHFIITYDGSGTSGGNGAYTAFWNGTQATLDTSGAFGGSTNETQIGNAGGTWNGTIDNVLFYKRILSPADVLTIYNNISDSATFWTIGDEETEPAGSTGKVELISGTGTSTGFADPTIYVDGIETDTFPDTAWHHVVITDANGIFAGDLHLGSVGGTYYAGALDDLRVYDRALSANEVKRLYELGATTHINKTITTNPDLEDGLVGHWTFDGSQEAKIVDRSGNENHGNFIGGATSSAVTPGRIGQALRFDGSDDHIIAGVSGLSTIAGTICLWIKPRNGWSSSEVVDQYFVEYGSIDSSRVVLYLNDDGKINLFVGNSVRTSSQTTTWGNQWYHICGAFDSQGGKLYVDGIKNNEGTGGSITTPTDLYIGEGNFQSVDSYDGLLDDVRIYDRALLPEEIKRLYELGATTHINKSVTKNPDLEDGLVGHWTFDGPDINITDGIADRSGNENHGNFIGGATSSAVRPGRIGQALALDGVDDYIDAGSDSSLDITGSLTIAAWIKPDSYGDGNFGRIVDKSQSGSGFSLYLNNNLGGTPSGTETLTANILGGVSSDSTGHSGNPNIITLGEWQHVIVVYDSTVPNMTFYVDGVESGSANTGTLGTTVNTFKIADRHDLARSFDGLIDDVRIYDRALSAAEVKRLYELGGGR